MNLDNTTIERIGFGGGCHWCTEAVFQSLRGVIKVEQGYIASESPLDSFSEGVIVSFDTEIITLDTLTEIHLRTHESTKDHSMRDKYRSAVYVFDMLQQKELERIIKQLQSKFSAPLVTKVIPFKQFKASREDITNYYYNDPEKIFCKRFIDPKLQLLLSEYRDYVNEGKLIQN